MTKQYAQHVSVTVAEILHSRNTICCNVSWQCYNAKSYEAVFGS